MNINIKTKDLHLEGDRFVLDVGSANPMISWTFDDSLFIKFTDGLPDPDTEVQITLHQSQVDKIYRMLQVREQTRISQDRDSKKKTKV